MESFEKVIAHIHFDANYNPVCVPCSEYPAEWWGHRNAFGLVIIDTRTSTPTLGMKPDCPLYFKAGDWGDPEQAWKLKRLRRSCSLAQGIHISTRDLSTGKCLEMVETHEGIQALCGRVLDYFDL